MKTGSFGLQCDGKRGHGTGGSRPGTGQREREQAALALRHYLAACFPGETVIPPQDGWLIPEIAARHNFHPTVVFETAVALGLWDRTGRAVERYAQARRKRKELDDD